MSGINPCITLSGLTLNGAVGWHDDTQGIRDGNVWSLVGDWAKKFKLGCGQGAGIPSKASNLLHYVSAMESLTEYFEREKPGSMPSQHKQLMVEARRSLASTIQSSTIKPRDLTCFRCHTQQAYIIIASFWDLHGPVGRRDVGGPPQQLA